LFSLHNSTARAWKRYSSWRQAYAFVSAGVCGLPRGRPGPRRWPRTFCSNNEALEH